MPNSNTDPIYLPALTREEAEHDYRCACDETREGRGCDLCQSIGEKIEAALQNPTPVQDQERVEVASDDDRKRLEAIAGYLEDAVAKGAINPDFGARDARYLRRFAAQLLTQPVPQGQVGEAGYRDAIQLFLVKTAGRPPHVVASERERLADRFNVLEQEGAAPSDSVARERPR